MVDTQTINVFPSDTLQTIKSRLAANVNSLPKYIDFEISEQQLANAKRTGTLTVNFLNALKIFQIPFGPDVENPFEQFYNYPGIKTLIVKNNLNVLRDIALPFVFFHNEQGDTDTSLFRGILTNIESEIKKVLQKKTFLINLITYKNDYNAFFQRLAEDIAENQNANETFLESVQQMEQLPGLQFTPFKAKEITFVFSTNINYLSLLSVFDKINLDELFVFATVDDYFKIYKPWNGKEKIEELQQKEKLENVIILYMSDNEMLKFYLDKNVLQIEFTLYSFSQMKNVLLERAKQILSKNIQNVQILNERQSSVKGIFLFPLFKLEPLVFAHVLLNDPIFSEQLYCDESDKAQGAKEFGGTTVFFEASTETVSAVLTSRKVNKYDVYLRGENMEQFPFNSDYMSVTVSKCNNLTSVSELQQFLSKRLALYNEMKNDIIKLYTPFLPDFPKRSEQKRKKMKKQEEDEEEGEESSMFMRKVYPELFTNRYLRKCDNSVELVTEDRLKDYKKNNVILFPKTESEGKQMYFGCRPDSKFPFIGLAENDPKSKFRLVPCCYAINQRDFPNSLLSRYLRGEKIEYECSGESKIKPRDFLTTDKSAGYERHGLLKPFTQIYALFNQPQFDQNFHFVRKGVDRSAFSFFQCIFEALRLPYNIKENNCESRLQYLREIIETKLVSSPVLNVGRQAFHNGTLETIQQQLLNRHEYLSPQMFIDIFEAFFNVKIFVFSNAKNLIIPNHLQNYILDADAVKKDVIFILENHSEGDLPFPQCECIIFANKLDNDDFKSVFLPTDYIVQSTFQIFYNMIESKTFEKETTFYNFETFLKDETLTKEQVINMYGKTSMFVLDYKTEEILLYTNSPSCPLPLKEKTQFNSLCSFKTALSFCTTYFSKENLTILYDEFDQMHSIKITLPSNTYFIPVVFTPKINLDIAFEQSTFIFPLNFTSSLLQNYLKNKNISHYLSEYFKFLLSVYAKENNLLTISTRNIVDFVNSKPYFGKKDYVYNTVPTKFNVQNQGFVKNGKIIVTSNELLKKLVYVLRLNKNHILHYANLSEIPFHFSNVLDFHVNENEILLKSFKNVIIFLDEEKAVHSLPL